MELLCNRTDNKSTWEWAIFHNNSAEWDRHGAEVASLTPYMPGSFGRTPRNPADKLNSGYKAWELLLYIFGLGPYLFHGLLTPKYWENFCMAVKAVQIVIQHEITLKDLDIADNLFCEFSYQCGGLCVQSRMEGIHFVCPVIHGISHETRETFRIGPQMNNSQWTLERIIGDLGREIKQHSNAFENLSQRALRRCQVNALKAIIFF